jgi:Transmembrane protein 33/Nucleoporin POM33
MHFTCMDMPLILSIYVNLVLIIGQMTVPDIDVCVSCISVVICCIFLNGVPSVALLPVFLYAVLHAQNYTKQLLNVSIYCTVAV